jgi:hypothetical protein
MNRGSVVKKSWLMLEPVGQEDQFTHESLQKTSPWRTTEKMDFNFNPNVYLAFYASIFTELIDYG